MFGDPWSLLILRDIVYFGKKTYGEFLASDEGIARNILADRLLRLQQKGIIAKKPHPTDKRKEMYEITEDGLSILPILLDMAEWGASHAQTNAPAEWLAIARTRREEVVAVARETVRSGGSIFVGDDSVVSRL